MNSISTGKVDIDLRKCVCEQRNKNGWNCLLQWMSIIGTLRVTKQVSSATKKKTGIQNSKCVFNSFMERLKISIYI
jgi:hypothetical protein